ncbi:MAG: hypothetical protein ABJB86_07695 [Bacteroidota bacterium]
MQETSQHIRERMLKNAARVWGYQEKEPEGNFDPVLSILLSACAIELEKISGEIQSSRSRVLERLVHLLSPDAFTAALPAHAVACARSVEPSHQINTDDQLYFTRKLAVSTDSGEQVSKDIFFSPTAPLPIKSASIKFIASGNSLYKADSNGSKELIGQSSPDEGLPASTLWLGIDQPGVSLQNSLFYFEFKSELDKISFYHQLPKAKWYWSGEHEMSHLPGYGNNLIIYEGPDLENVLNRDDDTSDRGRKHINSYYQPNFLNLTDEDNLSLVGDNSSLAGVITETFTGREAAQLQKQPLRWICLDFPKTVTTKMLEEVVCVMNCFPVYNRQLHDITFRLQEMVNIIPLYSEDIFLELEKVLNDDGDVLSERSFKSRNQDNAGILLRNGGVGRFDERDASSMVDYLVQLLRDERAAFSALGSDFINNELQQLQQILNKLEQRLSARQAVREQTPYLIVKNTKSKPWQNIFIRYWSTGGADGNNIWPASTLRLYKGSGFDGNQAILVTPTMGGKNKLNTSESVVAYKSALLSKDRLVTSEDIRVFCQFQLGDRVKKVAVQNGTMVHPDEQKGFVKTIDVNIDIHKKYYEPMVENGEVEFWKENLKLLIEEKSAALFPYRVEIKQAV